ncbi:MAG: DUF4250 domain-containing protein [Lachnospiraceae bacterium]|nr:DUF4250 domain-containing protein [Lachnospiraceae bacterium]MDY4837807.1 DUF4250 domain-containing protein [Lachnospiraceae bacterium]
MNIPNDAAMLLSFVNLKLRDYYKSLDDFCLDVGISKEEIIDKLKSIDYEYDINTNQFT